MICVPRLNRALRAHSVCFVSALLLLVETLELRLRLDHLLRVRVRVFAKFLEHARALLVTQKWREEISLVYRLLERSTRRSDPIQSNPIRCSIPIQSNPEFSNHLLALICSSQSAPNVFPFLSARSFSYSYTISHSILCSRVSTKYTTLLDSSFSLSYTRFACAVMYCKIMYSILFFSLLFYCIRLGCV